MEKDKEKIKKEESEAYYNNQIKNYNNLSIFKSARGQVVLFFIGILLLTFILSLFNFYDGFIDVSDFLLGLLIYIPILFFIYKGHRWAMIVLMIVWTFEKIYTLILSAENGGNVLGSVIWLIVGLSLVYKALLIENDRKKKIKTNYLNKKSLSYCSSCGTKQEDNNKFCANCGFKIL